MAFDKDGRFHGDIRQCGKAVGNLRIYICACALDDKLGSAIGVPEGKEGKSFGHFAGEKVRVRLGLSGEIGTVREAASLRERRVCRRALAGGRRSCASASEMGLGRAGEVGCERGGCGLTGVWPTGVRRGTCRTVGHEETDAGRDSGGTHDGRGAAQDM